MPINRLLNGSALGAEQVEKLNRAYTYALRSLHLIDRNDLIVDIVARRIIEVGATGLNDPEQILKVSDRKIGVQSP